MQKKLKVMFKILKLIKIYKKNIFVRSRTFKNVQKIKFWETTVVRCLIKQNIYTPKKFKNNTKFVP